jgi:hypothetical protein
MVFTPNSLRFHRVGEVTARVGWAQDLGFDDWACSRKDEKSGRVRVAHSASHRAAVG